MRTRVHSTRGSVLIQVVVALAVIFGFTALTTDYGQMVLRQRKLQSATDAAALAAGPEMYQPYSDKAISQALRYAQANSASRIHAEMTGPYTIRVTASDDVTTPFLHVLDRRKTTSRVSAVSEVAAFSPTTIDITAKVRPWGIPYTMFDPYEGGGSPIHYNEYVQLTLVPNADEQPTGMEGTFFIQPFALNPGRQDPANGPFNNYMQDIKFGYADPLRISYSKDPDTWMISQPGDWQAILDATRAALVSDPNSLLNRARDSDRFKSDRPDAFQPDNPRVIFIPVYDRINRGQGSGTIRAQILAFTAFYVESMQDNHINGYFVPFAMPYDGTQGRLDPLLFREPNTGIIEFALVK